MISGDKNYNGVIDELVNGSWISQTDNKQYGIPIKNIEIRKTLDGRECDLIEGLHSNQKLLVVSDPFTHKAMGSRIFKNLKSKYWSISLFFRAESSDSASAGVGRRCRKSLASVSFTDTDP